MPAAARKPVRSRKRRRVSALTRRLYACPVPGTCLAPWVSEMGYTVLKLDELEWSKPSAGDQSRGIVRLSDQLEHMRANIWRLPPGTSGRRHAERVQEEIFVVLS